MTPYKLGIAVGITGKNSLNAFSRTAAGMKESGRQGRRGAGGLGMFARAQDEVNNRLRDDPREFTVTLTHLGSEYVPPSGKA